MDGTEFAQQLATFASVEQQMKASRHLEAIDASLTSSELSDASALLGRRVSLSTPSILFEGAPVPFRYELPEGAQQGVAVLTKEDGTIVAQVPLSGQKGKATWQGETVNGGMAKHGTYIVRIHATGPDGVLGPEGRSMDAKTLVKAVEITADSLRLRLEDGRIVTTAEILAVF